jgi:hypothetical protein
VNILDYFLEAQVRVKLAALPPQLGLLLSLAIFLPDWASSRPPVAVFIG